MHLQIEYVPKEQLVPYANNAKLHTAEQVEQIKESIRKWDFNDPIAIWGDNEVVEGHGRLLAVMEMDDVSEVPIIRLDHLSEEERRAYALVHNKLTMNTDFDLDLLQMELDDISIDMGAFGFGDDLGGLPDFGEEVERYSKEVKIPQYTPSDDIPAVESLIDSEKVMQLIEQIDSSGVKEDEKAFLRMAAYRHAVINFDKVADYYASASKAMQELMEKNALVIIDFDDAIANGYTALSSELREIATEE